MFPQVTRGRLPKKSHLVHVEILFEIHMFVYFMCLQQNCSHRTFENKVPFNLYKYILKLFLLYNQIMWEVPGLKKIQMKSSLLKIQLRIRDTKQQRKMREKEVHTGSCGNNLVQNTSSLALLIAPHREIQDIRLSCYLVKLIVITWLK